MNKLSVLTIISFSLILFSCSKQIEGKVVDNFGVPIKDITVKVANTQYETKTNSNGKYSIDYAAGEVMLNFTNEDYLGFNKWLLISEKQTYPLEEITLTRKPKEWGIYIASKELDNYVKMPPQGGLTTKIVEEKKAGSRYSSKFHAFYATKQDSLTIIKVSSLEDIRIYHYLIKPMSLGKLGEDNLVAKIVNSVFMLVPTINNPIKANVTKVNNNMTIHTFQPEYGVTYAYVYGDGLLKNREYTPVNLFRFEKK